MKTNALSLKSYPIERKLFHDVRNDERNNNVSLVDGDNDEDNKKSFSMPFIKKETLRIQRNEDNEVLVTIFFPNMDDMINDDDGN